MLYTALCIQVPVRIETFVKLAGLDETRVLSALEPLRSVIHFSDDDGIVSTLHASFPDFMFDNTRSRSFCCDMAVHSQLMARNCFDIMSDQLRFNICNLESSFVPDVQVESFQERIDRAITPSLAYSGRYWANHLRLTAYSDLLRTMLNDFLSIRLLFWMEVLNLRRGIGLAAEMMVKAIQWLKVRFL